MQQTGIVLKRFPLEWTGLHRIDAYFPLSTEETPIEVLNESWKSILKIEIIQQKIQQENPLPSLATAI
jgi:hypothetical protein